MFSVSTRTKAPEHSYSFDTGQTSAEMETDQGLHCLFSLKIN